MALISIKILRKPGFSLPTWIWATVVETDSCLSQVPRPMTFWWFSWLCLPLSPLDFRYPCCLSGIYIGSENLNSSPQTSFTGLSSHPQDTFYQWDISKGKENGDRWQTPQPMTLQSQSQTTEVRDCRCLGYLFGDCCSPESSSARWSRCCMHFPWMNGHRDESMIASKSISPEALIQRQVSSNYLDLDASQVPRAHHVYHCNSSNPLPVPANCSFRTLEFRGHL